MLLKSGYQGVIQLLAAARGGVPEVEFEGGEGPGEVMDQIQTFAVPWIKKAIDPAGPALLWEELDLEAGEVRRRRSLLESRLEFELCRDDQGIELLLPREEGASAGRAPAGRAPAGRASAGRAWVPLRALAEPGPRQRSALGWRVEEPRLVWRYVAIGKTPTIEVAWRCGSIYRSWAEEVERRFPVLKCRLGPKSVCQLSRVDGPLSYRGHYPLPLDAWLPARWRLGLDQPLVLATEDGRARRRVNDEVPVTVEALDFRAILGGQTTRLVSLDDLAEPFEAEVLTAEEALLPDEIPAGMVPGLPWTVAVERHAPETAVASWNAGIRTHPAVTRRRRWTLRPQGGDGYWGQVDWTDYPPRLEFGLGAADPESAPEIARIPDRKATVGWRLGRSATDGELLSFTVPYWIPMGELGVVAALPCREHGFDYAAEVRARIDGLEERFAIDPASEVPRNRMFLDPRHWRFYDEDAGETKDAEALGEVDGYVRWSRPSNGTPGDPGIEVSPTDWAAGSAPVLLVRRPAECAPDQDVLDWGGLWAPDAVPWRALEEVRPERTAFDLVLTPRSPLPAVWISLWGFLCRYDRRPVIFSQTRREPQEIVTWIARTGLELFPRSLQDGGGAGRAFLTRSFSPLYAVRDSDPMIFALEPGGRRPILRLGRDLVDAEGARTAPASSRGARSIHVGDGTYLRYQLAASGRAPDFFSTGRIPGRSLLLPWDDDHEVLWLAVRQQREKAAGSPEAGYLLSWDGAAGWLFRGFFAEHDAAVELGKVRLGDHTARVFLGDETRAGRRAFRLTIDSEGHSWSAATPDEIAARVTAEMISEWERHHFARDRLPPALRGHEVRILRQPSVDGPWVFELLEREHLLAPDPPPGIRIWEPQEGAEANHLAGVKMLGEEAAARAPGGLPDNGASAASKMRLLAADEDEDDDF